MPDSFKFDSSETVESILARWGFGHREPETRPKGCAYGREVFNLATGESMGIHESPSVLQTLPELIRTQTKG